MSEPIVRLLEGLVQARTDAQRRAFAVEHLGDDSLHAVHAVQHMQRLVAVVVEAARDPSVRGQLEMIAAVADATGVVPETTLRAPGPPTSMADTVVGSRPDLDEPAPEARVDENPNVARSILVNVVADIDETLQGGNAPVRPAVLCRNLLDGGETEKALELYAALCAETESAPERRLRIQVIFGLMNEEQRRSLDRRFERLFAEQPSVRPAFEERVALLKQQLASTTGS